MVQAPQRFSFVAALLLAVLVVTGCQTPYQSYECHQPPWLLSFLEPGPCIGYSEIELAPGVYQVRFEGGANRALVEDYTLLRSAELALESGTRHFIVARVNDQTTTETVQTPGTYTPGQTTCSGHGNNKVCTTSMGYWSGGGSYTKTLPGYAYTIYLVDGPEVEGAVVYDAQTISRDLWRKYKLEPAHADVVVPPQETD